MCKNKFDLMMGFPVKWVESEIKQPLIVFGSFNFYTGGKYESSSTFQNGQSGGLGLDVGQSGSDPEAE